jgi:hypothetical protein
MALKTLFKGRKVLTKAREKAAAAKKRVKQLESGLAVRAGGKEAKGVERVKGASTRALGSRTGLRQTGKGKGARGATKTQYRKVAQSGRRRIAGTAAVGGYGISKLGGDKKSKPEPEAKNYNVGVSKGGVSFNESFAHHRKKLGAGKTFTWNGKKYTTNLKSEKKPKRKPYDKVMPGIRPLGGLLARTLLGEDEAFGGDKGLIDFVRIKPKKKSGGGEMTKNYSYGGSARSSKPRGVGAATHGYGREMK